MANRWFAAGADLLVGADCPGCGRPEPGLCGQCAFLLRPEPHDVPLLGTELRVIAARRYAGTTERVVRRLKGPGHRHAAAWASAALAAAVTAHGLDEPLLVPVPATRRSRRRRGGWLVRDLATGALPLLLAVGVQADVAPLVRMRRQTRDQRGLGAVERARNTRGAFRARAGSTDRPVLVVDDVVTTGATVQAVVRALDDAGHPVVGAAVVAATPPHVIARNTGE